MEAFSTAASVNPLGTTPCSPILANSSRAELASPAAVWAEIMAVQATTSLCGIPSNTLRAAALVVHVEQRVMQERIRPQPGPEQPRVEGLPAAERATFGAALKGRRVGPELLGSEALISVTPLQPQQSSSRRPRRCHDARKLPPSLLIPFLKASSASLSCGKQLAAAATTTSSLAAGREKL
ncbi:hypothetical protein E2562_014325 [Oryza meyeriana var. granulata]|uniref:Uncharacterized protein n=1 Tax=Oryza meyeriana var. granulata TaxID=110450 RepID=A0A6G1C6A6_9ORYZ|nr:hypothetical protein E2562_014325 [Oryza meyeriana var. granulata]